MCRFLLFLFSSTVQGRSALVSSSQPLSTGRIAGYAQREREREHLILDNVYRCIPYIPKPDGCHCGQDHLERSSFWRNWDRGWAMLLDSLLHNMGFQNSCLIPEVNLWLWHTGVRADWIPIAAFARNSYFYFDFFWHFWRLLTHVQCWKLFDRCFVTMDISWYISSIICHMDPNMGPIGSLAANPSRQIDRFPSCRTRVSATRREGRLMWFSHGSHGFPLLLFCQILYYCQVTWCKAILHYIYIYYIIYIYIYIHSCPMITDRCGYSLPAANTPWIIWIVSWAYRGVPCCCAFSRAELRGPSCCSTTSRAAGAMERSLCCSWTALDEIGRRLTVWPVFYWERQRRWETYIDTYREMEMHETIRHS